MVIFICWHLVVYSYAGRWWKSNTKQIHNELEKKEQLFGIATYLDGKNDTAAQWMVWLTTGCCSQKCYYNDEWFFTIHSALGISLQCLQPLEVAVFAEEMRFQWVAALTLDLRVQFQATILTLVAIQVITSVHCNHARHFCLISSGCNHFETASATRRESFMVTVQAIRMILFIHGEWNAVKGLLASWTNETLWVECFAEGA